MDPRIDPEPSADERVTLNGFLDYYRGTMLTKIDGLTDEQARTRFVGSDTTLLGLVRHLTEVERNWFRRRLRGEDAPPLYYSDADPDGDFHPGLDWTIAEAVAAYERECEVSRVIVADTASLDELTVVPITRLRRAREPALDPRAHDRGDRAPCRPRRHPARADRRSDRRLSRPTSGEP